MSQIFFEDAVTARNIDLPEQYGVYYADGLYANRREVAARLPHAKLYAITVHGLTGLGVFACDCENGDLTPQQAVAWVAVQVKLNVPLIAVYANLSTWNGGLLQALAKYGSRIKRWIAHYDNIAHVPAGYDCKQYAAPGPIDRNIALPSFFVPYQPPPPPKPHGRARFEGTVDLATGVWTIHGLPTLGARFAGPQEWMSAEIQIDRGSDQEHGHWRIRGIPLNSGPLG